MRSSSVFFLFIVFLALSAGAQHISRNDSLRIHFEEMNRRGLAKRDIDMHIHTGTDSALNARRARLRARRDNPQLPVKKRISAQWGLVHTVLYRDPESSYPDVMEYIRMSREFSDSVKTLPHALSCLGYYYRRLEMYDSAQAVYQRSLEVARKIQNSRGELDALMDLALLDESRGNYAGAITMCQEVLDSSVARGERTAEARCRINLGNLYVLDGRYAEALNELQIAYDLCTIRNLDGFMAAVYRHTGDLNLAIDDLNLAEANYANGLKWAESMHNAGQKRNILQQFIRLRQKQNRPEEALRVARELLSFSQANLYPHEVAEDYTVLARVYLDQGHADSALYFVKQALQLYERPGMRTRQYVAQHVAGMAELELGRIQEAEAMCQASYRANRGSADKLLQRDNCRCLYAVYKEKGADSRALHYLESYDSLNRALNSEAAARELIKAQLAESHRYESYRDSLNNRRSMELMALENDQKLEARTRLILILSIGFLLLVAVALVLWFAFRQNRRQRLELDALNRLNKQIFSIISHDFREPLMSMNMMVDALGSARMNEDRMRMYMQDIRHQVARTSHILDNLLNWARAELKIDLSDQPETGLHTLAEEIREVFAPKLSEKQLEFVLNVSPEVRLNIHPDLLRILLRNLISNAVKYTPEGGRIELGYDPVNREIFVRDTGIGMRPEELESLMKEPVYSRPGTARESGFGIGLFITRQLIGRIGWKLRVESELGKGTTFFVRTKP